MQDALWHDTVFDAARSLVEAIGPKECVGGMWPLRDDVETARTYLLHCLDPERAEKLGLEEFVWLLRRGRAIGCHVLAEYLGQACQYKLRPIDPAAAQADLAARMEQTMTQAAGLLRQWERMRGGRP